MAGDAVLLAILVCGVRLCTAEVFGERWEKVLRCADVACFARFLSRPANQQRNADASLIQCALSRAQRKIARRDDRPLVEINTAIVASEDNNRPFGQSKFVQFPKYATDIVIHAIHHAGIRWVFVPSATLLASKSIDQMLWSFDGTVDGVVPQTEEEGAMPLRFNDT